MHRGWYTAVREIISNGRVGDRMEANSLAHRDEDTRKDDIVEKLHEHLQANATRLSRIPAFESYYGMRRSTPSKARESNAVAIAGATSDDPEVKSVMKARGKKPAKVKEESE